MSLRAALLVVALACTAHWLFVAGVRSRKGFLGALDLFEFDDDSAELGSLEAALSNAGESEPAATLFQQMAGAERETLSHIKHDGGTNPQDGPGAAAG